VRVDQLNAQLAALREQLSHIAAALDVSEASQRATGPNRRTRQASQPCLVNKVEELARYRSEFFGRLRQILGEPLGHSHRWRPLRVPVRSIVCAGKRRSHRRCQKELAPVIAALKEISAKIPPDINWILRIDGHTDRRPISNPQFPSNWELSTARALSVVRFAIDEGIPAARLAAAARRQAADRSACRR